MQRANGKLRIVEPKQGTSRRTVVPRLAVQHLREHRKRQNAQRLALGEAWREHGKLAASLIWHVDMSGLGWGWLLHEPHDQSPCWPTRGKGAHGPVVLTGLGPGLRVGSGRGFGAAVG